MGEIEFQKLGGLSPLSVTDRGESLLIFESLFIAQGGAERGTPARMGRGFGAAEWNPLHHVCVPDFVTLKKRVAPQFSGNSLGFAFCVLYFIYRGSALRVGAAFGLPPAEGDANLPHFST